VEEVCGAGEDVCGAGGGETEKKGATRKEKNKGSDLSQKRKGKKNKSRMKVQVLLEAEHSYGLSKDAVMLEGAVFPEDVHAAGSGQAKTGQVSSGQGLSTDWAFGSHSRWDSLDYPDREVVLVTLKDVFLSGNDGLLWDQCNIYLPNHDFQVICLHLPISIYSVINNTAPPPSPLFSPPPPLFPPPPLLSPRHSSTISSCLSSTICRSTVDSTLVFLGV
jgi:hypothetical protein